jgi:hypothetical protein
MRDMPTGTKITDIPTPTHTSIMSIATLWQRTKRAKVKATAKEKKLNDGIKEFLEAEGNEDDKGNRWFDFPTDMPGYTPKGDPMKYNTLKAEKRVSLLMDEAEAEVIAKEARLGAAVTKTYLQVIDPEKAIATLEAAGLLTDDAGFELLTRVDQDALVLAYFEGKLTKEQYDRAFRENVTWALIATKI